MCSNTRNTIHYATERAGKHRAARVKAEHDLTGGLVDDIYIKQGADEMAVQNGVNAVGMIIHNDSLLCCCD